VTTAAAPEAARRDERRRVRCGDRPPGRRLAVDVSQRRCGTGQFSSELIASYLGSRHLRRVARGAAIADDDDCENSEFTTRLEWTTAAAPASPAGEWPNDV
jgi:hypothetical protein